jgi:hypothetical protein
LELGLAVPHLLVETKVELCGCAQASHIMVIRMLAMATQTCPGECPTRNWVVLRTYYSIMCCDVQHNWAALDGYY